MSKPRILCIIPAERDHLAQLVFQSGAIPVIDITCSDRSSVPKGAWIRTRSKRDIPGKGPIILAGENHRSAIRGRETWLEVSNQEKFREVAGYSSRKRSRRTLGEASIWDGWDKLSPASTILTVVSATDMSLIEKNNFGGIVISDLLLGFSNLVFLLMFEDY